MADDGDKIECPKCHKMIVPNVTKYGCGGGASQRICPFCGNRIGGPKGVACCFIATAAYGSPLDNRVQVLCNYRDNYLTKTIWGRMFIRCYYAVSPSIANCIAQSARARALVRGFLNPVVSFVEKFTASKQ